MLAGTRESAQASVTAPLHGEGDAVAALHRALKAIAGRGDVRSVEAVGHRVVHGGSEFTRTTLIDDDVLARIRALARLAPLHNPVAAAVIAAARERWPDAPHAAAFDSAFHATLPAEAYVYALPHEWYTQWGYRRYGFHGLSVTWSVERTAALLGRTDLGIVIAHLGAGCSVSAVWQGRSVSTSMGMTPLEGLVMATRAGSVDPGVLLAAQREHGLDASALEETLERRSGLLALSGASADMRELLALASTNERAALAIAVFERSAAAAIAAAATALPRLDAIVFTGGIGENAGSIRCGIAQRLSSIGVPSIDDRAIAGDEVLIDGPVSLLVVAAREDAVIARETHELLAQQH